MSKYNYSEELKAPLSFGEINFENPVINKAMQLIFLYIKWQTEKYKPPKGIRKTLFQINVHGSESIPCFLIEPQETTEDLPVIVYYHGGGFICPVQKMMLDNSSYFVERLKCRVFLPNYRLAPKYPFPIPLEDSYAALLHIQEHAKEYCIDMEKLIIYGDSAGGCLTAGVTHLIRDRGGPRAKGQMLIYPTTDNSMNHKSMDEYKDAVWPKKSNQHIWNLYLKKCEDGMLKYAAPLNSDDFTGLPAAYVEPAEMDTLRDEAVEYAHKLMRAGIPTELNIIKGAYHAFDAEHSSPLVQRVLNHRCEVMKMMLRNE